MHCAVKEGKNEFSDDVALPLPDTVRGDKVDSPGACSNGLSGGDREAGERYSGECSLSGDVADDVGPPDVCRKAWCDLSADIAEPASFFSPALYEAERLCGRLNAPLWPPPLCAACTAFLSSLVISAVFRAAVVGLMSVAHSMHTSTSLGRLKATSAITTTTVRV